LQDGSYSGHLLCSKLSQLNVEITIALSIWPDRVGIFLPDGDRLQPPKRHVFFFIKDRRWIMSKKFVISIKPHRHKPSELTGLIVWLRGRICHLPLHVVSHGRGFLC
jgi:hypothetical protein